MTIRYCDWLNGSDVSGNGSNTNPYKTITQASTGLTGGDEVRVAKSPSPTSLSGTISFSIGATTVNGSGTSFLTDITAGDFIQSSNGFWWEVANISNNTTATLLRAFSFSNESGTSFKKLGYTNCGAAASLSTVMQYLSSSGTSALNKLYVSGGWDLSGQVQDGYTWFRQMHSTVGNHWGVGLDCSNRAYYEISKIGLLRFYNGFLCSGTNTNSVLDNCQALGIGNYGYYIATNAYRADMIIRDCIALQCYNYGFQIANASMVTFLRCHSHSAGGTGFYLYNASSAITFDSCESRVNSSSCLNLSTVYNSKFNNCIFYQSAGSLVVVLQTFCEGNQFNGCTIYGEPGISISASINNQFTDCVIPIGRSVGISYTADCFYNTFYNLNSSATTDCSFGGSAQNLNGGVIGPNISLVKLDNTLNNDWFYSASCYANKQSAITQTNTGFAWALRLFSTYNTSDYPARFPLAKIACLGGKPVTVTVWVKKEHATQNGAALRVRGGYLSGVSEGQSSPALDNTNWQQLTINFTPNENGVVPIDLLMWYRTGIANRIFVDTLEVN